MPRPGYGFLEPLGSVLTWLVGLPAQAAGWSTPELFGYLAVGCLTLAFAVVLIYVLCFVWPTVMIDRLKDIPREVEVAPFGVAGPRIKCGGTCTHEQSPPRNP